MAAAAVATNSEGRAVHEGAGTGAGTIYCGFRYTSGGACPCGGCDGMCGPTNGCPCPSCRRMLAEILVTANMRCPAGHPLVRMLVKDLRAQEGARGYVDGFRCDRCSGVCERGFQAAMHCSSCKFDLCATCTWAALAPELKANIPPLADAPSAPPLPESASAARAVLGEPQISVAPKLKCSSGHNLESVTMAELRQRSSGYTNGFVCDSCRRSWQERQGTLEERVMHCDVCQYDLCAECVVRLSAPVVPTPPPSQPAAATGMRCRAGHLLEAVTVAELARRDSDYEGGYGCDLCSGSGSGNPQEVVMHCQQCSYDVCPTCAARAGAQGTPAAPASAVPDEISTARPTPPAAGPAAATGMRCSAGHPLEAITMAALIERDRRYRGGYGCDICSGSWSGNPAEVVMHCQQCTYDVCPRCAARAGARAGLAPTSGVPDEISTVRPSGGGISTIGGGGRGGVPDEISTVRPSAGSDGISTIGGGSSGGGISTFGGSGGGGISTIGGGGGAPTGMRCSAGHPLESISMAALIDRDRRYRGGYSCDLCGSSWSGNPQEVIMHCQPCTYDLCPRCAARGGAQTGSAPATGLNAFGGASGAPGATPASTCVNCHTAPATTMLMPCKHLCCCKSCAGNLDHCPVCHGYIVARVKVFS